MKSLRGVDAVAPASVRAGDDVVSLYRAPQRGQATGPFNPADFPGRGGAVLDGRAYFIPDRELAEAFAKSMAMASRASYASSEL